MVGLRRLGLEVTYVSRRPSAPVLVGAIPVPVITYAELSPELLAQHTVIVNASPVGMAPAVEEAPQLPYDALTSAHLLYDLIYNPEETHFLHEGAQRGCCVKTVWRCYICKPWRPGISGMLPGIEAQRPISTNTPYIYRRHKVVNSAEFTTLRWFMGVILEKTAKPHKHRGGCVPKAQSCR